MVGSARNLQLVVATASNSASLTADEIIVETALGGLRYCLSSFSQTINLATTGAGGMDAGSAPATGFVALYAIYNPATKAAALLATGLASTAPPNTYGGGHMPAGYTASALLSIWATNSSGQLAVGYQYDRTREFPIVDVFSTSTSASTPTIFSIASAVPLGAKSFGGTMTSRNSTAGAGTAAAIMGSASGIGQTNCNSSAGSANFGVSIGYKNVPILVPQTAYYTMSASTGGPGFQVAVGSYTI
ncbi:hypothetical protein RO07_23185 [Pandoraea pulmonicola]|uniref:Phage tail protein n=1 Tax=Pandoraea pulmonicola TaxID=93221 RepID=A0ABN4F1N3_PANPU|nr:hypothetical protein RO07_23185 [Pandoraea pulmonicola]